ncbi:hypothetical protein L7F22_022177 [Adiantum nelumboides]|nr:hypothetical protein [Adiantum nelumboides]
MASTARLSPLVARFPSPASGVATCGSLQKRSSPASCVGWSWGDDIFRALVAYVATAMPLTFKNQGRKLVPRRQKRSKFISTELWEPPKEIFCFDAVSRLWGAPLESRISFASASVNGFVYAAGGTTGRDFENLKSVERFDLFRKKWERIADMKKRRFMAAGVALKGSFCVLGGRQEIQKNTYVSHDSAEIWDPLTEEWQLIPDMW